MQPPLPPTCLPALSCNLSLAMPPCVRDVIHQTSMSSITEGSHSPVLHPLQGSWLLPHLLGSILLTDPMHQVRCGRVEASPLLYGGVGLARLFWAAKFNGRQVMEQAREEGFYIKIHVGLKKDDFSANETFPMLLKSLDYILWQKPLYLPNISPCSKPNPASSPNMLYFAWLSNKHKEEILKGTKKLGAEA